MILIQELFWWTEPEGGWKATVVCHFVICLFGWFVGFAPPPPSPTISFPLKPLHQYVK